MIQGVNPTINYDDFILLDEGLQEVDREKALKNLYQHLTSKRERFLGYQVNHRINHGADLLPFLNMHINNVGDPFIESNYTMSSKAMEKATLEYYSKLWNGVTPHHNVDPESYWGYTLSMGSTEGNVYAIWSARDYLSGKALLLDGDFKSDVQIVKDGISETPLTPIAFYSQDTHYSIKKAMRVLNFQTFYDVGSEKYMCPLKYPEDYPKHYSKGYIGKNNWPFEVPSNPDGTIHIPALTKLIDFFTEKRYPVFVCYNYGTTFKGAYDPIKEAIDNLVPILKKNNMYEREMVYMDGDKKITRKRNGFWFHVDGALGAAFMPFVEKLVKEKKVALPEGYEFPVFDFRIPEVNSIVTSIHKWIGAPFSCGLFMTKTKYQLLPPANPMYIGSPDTTFAGSRNGITSIFLWNFLASHSIDDLKEVALKTIKIAEYAEKRLKELEVKLKKDLWVNRSPLSLTVRFRKPNDTIVLANTLSCEMLYENDEKRSYAHIFAMDHVTEEMIDLLIEDLSKPDAYPELQDFMPVEVRIPHQQKLLSS